MFGRQTSQSNSSFQRTDSPVPNKTNPASAHQPYPATYEQALGLTDKQIRKLKRVDLLELLVEQGRELERLRGELALAQAQLEDKRIMLESCGSIAEASLKINGVFEAAQAAANQYLQAVQESHPQAAQLHSVQMRAEQPQQVQQKAAYPQVPQYQAPHPQAVRPQVPQSQSLHPHSTRSNLAAGADAQATGRLSVLSSAGSPAVMPAASPAPSPAVTPAASPTVAPATPPAPSPAARVAGNHFAAAGTPAPAAGPSSRGRHMAGA